MDSEPQELQQNFRAPKPRTRAAVVMLFTLLAATTGYAGYEYGQRQSTEVLKDTPTAPVGTKKAPTETVKGLQSFDYTKNLGAPPSYVSSEFSMEVPASWRTQIATGLNPDAPGCDTGSGQVVKKCIQLSFANALGEPAGFVGTNSLEIYGLEDWSRQNTPRGNDLSTFAGLETVRAKKAAIDATLSLSDKTVLSPEMMQTLFQPFHGGSPTVGISQMKYVESADGTLKGYAFIATRVNQQEYRPHAYVAMLGRVENVLGVVAGDFQLNDKQKAELAAKTKRGARSDDPEVQKFFTDYKNGFEYGADTKAQFDEVRGAVKTIKLEPSAKE